MSSDDFLTISPRIRVLPIIHGSGDFAVQVREELLSRPYDCVAVPLPPSFQEEVEAAVDRLPAISVVVQVDAEVERRRDGGRAGFSYVPIDPCQGVIAAIRTARENGSRGNSSTWRHRVSSGHGYLPGPLCTQAGQSRAVRRGHADGHPASAARPGHRAHRLDGGAAPRAGIAVSPDPPGLLDPRLALDSRRLPARTRTAPARDILLTDPDVRRRSQDAHLRAGRVALYHGACMSGGAAS